jgi:hypothetical protein
MIAAVLPPALQQLELAENELEGPLPDMPPSMIYLDVSSNKLTGDISGLDFGSFQVRLAWLAIQYSTKSQFLRQVPWIMPYSHYASAATVFGGDWRH